MSMLMFVLKLVVGLALLVVVAFGLMSAWSRFSPPAVGLVEGKLRPCPDTPNCISSQATQPEKQVQPLPYLGDRAATEAALRKASMRLDLVSQSQEGDYWHHIATSSIFRFLDDVEFQFDDAARVVQVRSGSRSGYSDRGVNRARVEALRDAMSN